MRPRDALKQLGYGADVESIRAFQRDYNALGTLKPLAITGRLDGPTLEALKLSNEARDAFVLFRDGSA